MESREPGGHVYLRSLNVAGRVTALPRKQQCRTNEPRYASGDPTHPCDRTNALPLRCNTRSNDQTSRFLANNNSLIGKDDPVQRGKLRFHISNGVLKTLQNIR